MIEQETKILTLLLSSNELIEVFFNDKKPEQQKTEMAYDEIEAAKKQKRPVFLGMLEPSAMFFRKRKVTPFEFFDSERIVGWTITSMN